MKKIIITENQYKRLIEISSPHKTYGDDYLTPKEEYFNGNLSGTLALTFSTPLNDDNEYSFGDFSFYDNDFTIEHNADEFYDIKDISIEDEKFNFTVMFNFSINCENDTADDEIIEKIMTDSDYEVLGVHLNEDDLSYDNWTMDGYDILDKDFEEEIQ